MKQFQGFSSQQYRIFSISNSFEKMMRCIWLYFVSISVCCEHGYFCCSYSKI